MKEFEMRKKIAIFSVCMVVVAVAAMILFMSGDTYKEHYDLGVKYLSENDYEKAVAEFTTAIEIEPSEIQSYIKRAEAFTTLDLFAEAESDYKTALYFDEYSADSYLGMAELYLRQKKIDEAIEILQTGFKITKDKRISEKLESPEITEKLYADLLEKHPPQEIMAAAGYVPENIDYINYYAIQDIDHDGEKELITCTGVNFRYAIFKFYNNKNGVLSSYKDINGTAVELHLDSGANGSMWLEFCNENHIHHMWAGGPGTREIVYRIDKKIVDQYLFCEQFYNLDHFTEGEDSATKYGNPISISEFEELSKVCGQEEVQLTENIKENREKITVK